MSNIILLHDTKISSLSATFFPVFLLDPAKSLSTMPQHYAFFPLVPVASIPSWVVVLRVRARHPFFLLQ